MDAMFTSNVHAYILLVCNEAEDHRPQQLAERHGALHRRPQRSLAAHEVPLQAHRPDGANQLVA
jgi:hypothetical protein